jgi:transcription elongation factor GreA
MATKTTSHKPIYLSKEGLEKVKKELEELITVKREEVAERIAEAKSFGDLSENAEYENAKEVQAFTEGRITELQLMLKYASIIDEGASHEKVVLGSTVTVKVNKKEKEQFKIVGSTEADPLVGKISNESPIGSVLMGKHKGETVNAPIPSGVLELEIVAIS